MENPLEINHKINFKVFLNGVRYRYFKEYDPDMNSLFIGKKEWSDLKIKESGFIINYVDENKVWEYALYTIIGAPPLE